MRLHGRDALADGRTAHLVIARRGVGQHQGLDLLGEAHGQLLPDQPAHGQAHPDHGLAIGQLVDHAGRIGGQLSQVDGLGRCLRTTMAARVRADHPAGGGQLVGHGVPHAPVLPQRMAEHQGVGRRAMTCLTHGGVQLGPGVGEVRAAHPRVPRLVSGVGRRLHAQLFHDAHGAGKARVGRRHPGVDGDLDERLAHLVRAQRVGVARGEGAAQVDLELVPAAQGAGHGQHDDAAGFPVQPGSAPHAMPGVVGDEVLKAGVEGVGLGHRLVDPGVAQGRAAVAHAALEVEIKGRFRLVGHG